MKIALVENFGADFVGARLRYALFLKENGIEVTAIIPQDGHREVIVRQGIRVIEVGANIRGNGIANKINYAIQLKSVLKSESFDIVHFYRLQPNIIGTFIAGSFTNSKIVNHVTGLGVAFTNRSLKNTFLQFVIKKLYHTNNFCFSPFTIYQNKQDAFDLGIHRKSICIEGSAVNETKFDKEIIQTKREAIFNLKKEIGITVDNTKVFLFVSRLLKEKGILELIEGFIEAQKKLKTPIFLLIVGWSDIENPSSVSLKALEERIKDYSNVKLLGKRSDVDLLLALSDISILPTYYREGTPRFLLESMSMGKAIITTDMPGCNHLIPTGENGELIQPKSVTAIENAILRILNRDLIDLGIKSNELYQEKFSEKKVYPAILKLYKTILS
ncbi:glycosyltransferase [Flavobacterium sp. N3904]|uniref:glycosyltransferase n=1 Tax=Flavobacterium sp. N3904 TaxID=2986835 RepID=UPI0022253387|nr:glycosyltransferase [Flavobacterium sp. N3904]